MIANDAPPTLEVRDLGKRFGAIQALTQFSLKVRAGEIHGLVGANGAGKSTLVKLLAGVESPDEGEILLDGQPVRIRDARHSRELGFSFIHQELNLIPKLTAIQNMTLGLTRHTRLGLIDWRATKRDVAGVAARLDIRAPLDTPVENLSTADRWLVSIGAALIGNAKLVAMDEPTASLSKEESERLFRIIRDLSSAGVPILYVSHRLEEILSLCSRVTVLKDGLRVVTLERDEISNAALVRHIVGADVTPLAGSGGHAVGNVVFEARELRRAPSVRGVSFHIREGEILGLAGLVGSGRTEIARLIFGADHAESGEMWLDGKRLDPRDPHEAVRRGVALVPEERRSQGLLLQEALTFNVNLPSWSYMRRRSWLPLVDHHRADAQAIAAVGALSIKTRSVKTPVVQLSGGNQQKVVIGKWLARRARLVILDEPTRGVDVGARQEIYKIVRQLADEGRAVIVISSELQEMVICDRVLVVVEGQVVGEIAGGEITEESILHMCYTNQPSRSAS